MIVPPGALQGVKKIVQHVYAPGYSAGVAARDGLGWMTKRAERYLATADDLSEAREENKRLSARNRRLRAALLAARAELPTDGGADEVKSADGSLGLTQSSEPLLDWDVIEARVLGYRARAFLARTHLIAGGEDSGFMPENLVLEAVGDEDHGDDLALTNALIDQGANARLESGQLALAGRGVWGKIVEVGPQISIVRRVNESGYRDLVQLATRDGQRIRLGPRGIVHGTGERWCRIQLVKTTEPVEVGDLVFAAGGEGLIEAHLSYGKVARVERSPGDVHWQIWMEPALPEEMSEKISVLRVQPNRNRVAAKE